ncbi:hypothetical protein [Flavobacterium lacisediminis]|uniref:Uncharacterized protein n=1 Tax=Flavobacterium lacisediminis TaxID=2989705 RepID=A0ABT3EJ52_9FLAO|nr:hypothetical protein [Flavobacterium lacisediminis]MCW1148441.1 hypothetical protein [Flavobacterium lacisediminis]
MEKRDLIQAEIEKLGFFLQRLLANFLNGNSAENSIEASDLITNEFKNELDFDLPLFLSLSNDEMKKYLSNFKFNEQNLEKLADLLAEMNLSKAYLVRSIELLDLVDELSNSFSFERNNKKIKIQQLLNSQ